jgi:hypothetical protein
MAAWWLPQCSSPTSNDLPSWWRQNRGPAILKNLHWARNYREVDGGRRVAAPNSWAYLEVGIPGRRLGGPLNLSRVESCQARLHLLHSARIYRDCRMRLRMAKNIIVGYVCVRRGAAEDFWYFPACLRFSELLKGCFNENCQKLNGFWQ